MGKQHTSSANLGLEETTVVFHGFNRSDLAIYPSFCGGVLYILSSSSNSGTWSLATNQGTR